MSMIHQKPFNLMYNISEILLYPFSPTRALQRICHPTCITWAYICVVTCCRAHAVGKDLHELCTVLSTLPIFQEISWKGGNSLEKSPDRRLQSPGKIGTIDRSAL